MRGLGLLLCAGVLAAGDGVWTRLGPDSGNVMTLAADSRNPGTLYAGTLHGLFKSTDGGANWKPANAGLAERSWGGVTSLAVDPRNSGTVYAGVRAINSFPGGVFKSTDSGATWSPAGNGMEGLWFYGSLAIDPQNPLTLYAATFITVGEQNQDACRQPPCFRVGLFKSVDGAASWETANAGLPPFDSLIASIAVDPQDSRVVYAGTNGGSSGGIYKSTNGGASWVRVDSGVTCCTYFSPGILIDPQNHNTVYAVTLGGLRKSTDAGGHWSSLYSGLPGGNLRSVALDLLNPRTLYASSEGGFNSRTLFKSVDGGQTWAVVGFPLDYRGALFALVVDPFQPGTLYGAGSGIFKSLDAGASWRLASRGIGGTPVAAFAFDPQNSSTLYAVSYSTLFQTEDGGADWQVLSGPGSPRGISSLVADPRNPGVLLAGIAGPLGTFYQPGGMFKSLDAGASWNAVGDASWSAADAALGVGHYLFSGKLVMDPKESNTVYATRISVEGVQGQSGSYVFKSSDGGMSWAQLASFDRSDANILAIDPQNSATLYLAGSSWPAQVYSSMDGGVTWSVSALPPEAFEPPDDDEYWTPVTALVVDPRDSSIVYAAGSGGIFKSSDGGGTWTAINTGWSAYTCAGAGFCYEPNLVSSVAIDPRNGSLYAAITTGVIRSTDGGASWSQLLDGWSGIPAALSIDPVSGTVYAVTSGDGVYALSAGGGSTPVAGARAPVITRAQVAVQCECPEHRQEVADHSGAEGIGEMDIEHELLQTRRSVPREAASGQPED